MSINTYTFISTYLHTLCQCYCAHSCKLMAVLIPTPMDHTWNTLFIKWEIHPYTHATHLYFNNCNLIQLSTTQILFSLIQENSNLKKSIPEPYLLSLNLDLENSKQTLIEGKHETVRSWLLFFFKVKKKWSGTKKVAKKKTFWSLIRISPVQGLFERSGI